LEELRGARSPQQAAEAAGDGAFVVLLAAGWRASG